MSTESVIESIVYLVVAPDGIPYCIFNTQEAGEQFLENTGYHGHVYEYAVLNKNILKYNAAFGAPLSN